MLYILMLILGIVIGSCAVLTWHFRTMRYDGTLKAVSDEDGVYLFATFKDNVDVIRKKKSVHLIVDDRSQE